MWKRRDKKIFICPVATELDDIRNIQQMGNSNKKVAVALLLMREAAFFCCVSHPSPGWSLQVPAPYTWFLGPGDLGSLEAAVELSHPQS